MRIIGAVVATASIALGACGDNHMIDPDASVPDARLDAGRRSRCWTDEERVPSPTATATLGTGRDGFEPIPEVLPIEYGPTGGFSLIARVRMTGLAPGNPQDLFDPSNPATRIRAFFDDTGLPLNYYAFCPWRYGYLPLGDGTYEMPWAVAVIVELCWEAAHLYGRPIRIELEILDANGVYATDVKVVTGGEAAPGAPENAPGPGCEHPIRRGPALRAP